MSEYVLWGKHAAHGPDPIKLICGTLRECRGEQRRRERQGGWKLLVLAKGVSP